MTMLPGVSIFSNFVFFVAISLVGSLVTAPFLTLSKVQWRTPLTRIAEFIAVAAIILSAVSIIVDMGRPRPGFLYIILYAQVAIPNYLGCISNFCLF